jgi:hypothetical protein
MKTLNVIFCLFITLLSVNADPVYYKTSQWGTLYPLSGSGLEMVDEKIDIDVYRCSGAVSGIAFFYTEYRCNYTFKNNGADQTYLIGFPAVYPYMYGDLYKDYNIFLDDFHIYYQGQELNFEKYIHGINPVLKEISYDLAYGFNLKIDKGQVKNIQIIYTKIDYMLSWGDSSTIGAEYILKSGRALSKPIGNAVITLRFHFPQEVVKNNTLHDKSISYSQTDPYCTVKHVYKNFVPDSDFYQEYQVENDYLYNDKWQSEESKLLELTMFRKNVYRMSDGIREKHSLQSYFDLLRLLQKYPSSMSDSMIRDVSDILSSFYQTMLTDPNTPLQLLGFLVFNVEQDKNLAIDPKNASNAKHALETYAEKTAQRELGLIKRIALAVKEDIRDTETIKSFLFYVFQVERAVQSATYFDDEKHRVYNNIFFELIQKFLSVDEFTSENKKTTSLLTDFVHVTVDRLLKEGKNNINEILHVINLCDPESFDLQKYFVMNTEKLIGLLNDQESKNKRVEKEETARLLYKLVRIIQQASFLDFGPDDIGPTRPEPDSIKYGSGWWVEPVSFEIQLGERSLLRKAYNALGDYHIGSNPEFSIRFYRLGLSYGAASPLWDYLGGEMLGYFFGDIPQLHFGVTIKEVNEVSEEEYKKIVPPWGENLNATRNGIKEDVIINLYTPERLLSLPLDKWLDEGEANAPLYDLAYKIARAYVHMGDQKNTLQWLEVALKMNKKLKTRFEGDGDFVPLRKKYPENFKELIKS